MEKVYVAELMRIMKWSDGKIRAISLSSGFTSVVDAKKWIKDAIHSDMEGIYGYMMYLLDGIDKAVENAEVGKWYPYAHSNKDAYKHARYTYSITERYI